tara:strand:+ start:620 stop:982 length:363 start_codon:yes stop_codon:yes gene_type:complete
MTDTSDTIKKKLLKTLEKTLGIVTSACKNAGIHRSTYYEWYNKDVEFKKEVDDIQNVAIDFVESQLHKQIQNGSSSATIFYLKTKARSRGYQENQSIDLNATGEIDVNFKELISAIKDKE